MRLSQGRLAQADLAEIAEFGADRFGDAKVLDYLDRIEGKFRQLLDYPEIGRAEPELHPQARSLSCYAHRIYYSMLGDTITIRRILHKAREPSGLLD
jgi:toxin ParE1/3/4